MRGKGVSGLLSLQCFEHFKCGWIHCKMYGSQYGHVIAIVQFFYLYLKYFMYCKTNFLLLLVQASNRGPAHCQCVGWLASSKAAED